MAKESLLDVTVRNAKPGDKDIRLNDGGGLYLIIKSNGAKWWRLDYSFEGKRKTLSLGVYPVTGLADARRKAEEARKQISNGIDPSNTRKEKKAAQQKAIENGRRIDAGLPILNSFEYVARKWLASIAKKTDTQAHLDRTSRFNRYVYPAIGNMAIKDVKSSDIFSLIKPVIAKGTIDTAHRLRADISSVFCYAIADEDTDYDDYNPAQPVTNQIPARDVKRRSALTNPKDVGQLIRDIYNYQGTFVVQRALRLSPLLFQRPGEIRQMQWKDIDLEAKEWRYFVTKTQVNHIVPLSMQAIAILEEIKSVTGHERYVFPSIRCNGKPMSDGTIGAALKALGYSSDDVTPHGFRATASTLLNEQGFSPDAIERQLCHMPKDQVRKAYNRAQYLEERRRMMQAWADYLDNLKNGAQVIAFKKQG